VSIETEENTIDTYIVADAGISAFTQQILDCVNIAMFCGPHDRRPAPIILAQQSPSDFHFSFHPSTRVIGY